jgi:hypothetical protein
VDIRKTCLRLSKVDLAVIAGNFECASGHWR